MAKTITCWIVVYHHRHGIDAWLIWTNERPNLTEVANELDDWEPDQGEWLEMFGPFVHEEIQEEEACRDTESGSAGT